MPHPLDGPRRKIEWARNHLNSIYAQVDAWMDFEPPTQVRLHDLKTGKDFLGIRLMPPLPPYLGLLVGDFVHNLRSALDHLVGQLVIANGGEPDRNTAFPIFDDPGFVSNKAAFLERVSGYIGKCSTSAQDVIEKLQPYHRGNAYEISQHPLWMLHELDIIDKHRLITLIGGHWRAARKLIPNARATIGGIEVPVAQWFESGTFDDYIVVGEIGPDGETQSNFEPNIEIGVAIAQQPGVRPGTFAAASVKTIDILPGVFDYVRIEVIPRFARFFSKPGD